jgi:pimeloyl-ACP methyl ester carboxylesterase
MAHSTDFIEVAGCRTEVRRGGAGAPLLFLHGAGGNPGWMPFMEALAESYEVIAPSHPGFGNSDVPGWLDGIDDVAHFYLEFLAALDLSGVHLVGNSLGGWIAAEIAMRDASRLASLTLVAAAGIRVKGTPIADTFLWNDEERARNLFFDQTLAEAMLAQPLSPEAEDIAIKNRFATARLAWSPRFYSPQLRKWLHRVTLPTMIVWGKEDRIFPEPYAHAYKALLPQAELRILPECGHLPQVEKTAAFIEAVRAVAA